MKRIFLLDTDVGQSELTPPGLISLHEITQPLFSKKFFLIFLNIVKILFVNEKFKFNFELIEGAQFANQKKSFTHSFFFGSISPVVDFEFYKDLVQRCLRIYKSVKSPDSILFINSCGWIEGL